MRNYVDKKGIRTTPEQLAILVPAFDVAWQAVSRRGGFLLDENESGRLKDRVARTVVDLVLSRGLSDAEMVASEAVRRILPTNQA